MTGTFLSHGVRLEYRTEGEGKPLVFLHGLGGGIGQILSVYQPIDGVKLITLNQQGHGDSGAGFWTTWEWRAPPSREFPWARRCA